MKHKTIPRIAEQYNEKTHVIQYVVQSRRIRPAERVGIIRLFDDAGIEEIGRALREMRKYRPTAMVT
jgi:hypothetical protein